MEQNKMPRFSVIVPYHNEDLSLFGRSVQSLAGQKFQDYEVIIVNDGSDAEHSRELSRSVPEDPRFCLVEQDGQGVSAARNRGIQEAHGDYITFLDSDDELDPACLEKADRIINRTGADFLLGLTKLVYGEEDTSDTSGAGDGYKVLANNAERSVLKCRLIGHEYKVDGKGHLNRGIAGKFIRSELCSRLSFNREVQFGEDLIYMLEVLALSRRTVLVNSLWYLYHVNKDSATHKYNEKEDQIVAPHLMILRGMVDLNSPREYAAYFFRVYFCLWTVYDLMLGRREWKKSGGERKGVVKKLYSEEPWNILGSGCPGWKMSGKDRIIRQLYRSRTLFAFWRITKGIK